MSIDDKYLIHLKPLRPPPTPMPSAGQCRSCLETVWETPHKCPKARRDLYILVAHLLAPVVAVLAILLFYLALAK